MDRTADKQREREANASIIQGKRKIDYFDVFLSYNNREKSEIKEIGNKLIENGIVPWLDEWELQPGLPWQPFLERQIGQIKSAAVFLVERALVHGNL